MDVRLPKLGEGADSGTVVTVFVKEGDQIIQGQAILELENEKAVAPIPSSVSGRVTQVRVKEGDKISVGQALLTVEPAGAPPTSARPAPPAEPPTPPAEEPPPVAEVKEVEEAAPSPAEEELPPPPAGLAPSASPTIRKLARELGVDLRRVRGSERGGRIVMADLRAYIQRLQKLAARPKPAKAPPAPAPERIDFAKWGPIRKQPMSPLRQTISQRMLESWTTVPRVTQFDEADITALNDLRKKFAPAYEHQGARLTLTSFAVKAVAAVLKKHPLFNASLAEAGHTIVFKDYCHIGLAVDTEQGLIVPVIRDADRKDLLALSKDIGDLAEKARARKLSREEMQGGTFTISNQGGIGGAHFTPLVNQPEVAVLGLGRGALKAVVKDGAMTPRLMLPLGLSYDHRVIDGASAARFIVDLVRELEQFPEAGVAV